MPHTSASSLVFEIFPEEHISPELDHGIREMLTACFTATQDRAHFSRQRWWHSPHQWTALAFDGDRPVSGICVVEREIRVGDGRYSMAGIGNVCTVPEWRKQGIIDRVMARVLMEARNRGCSLAVLFCKPALEKVYRRMGYERLDRIVAVRDADGVPVLKEPKDIAMGLALDGTPFPPGDIDLLGRDW